MIEHKINGKTAVYGILGESVENSLSPIIHNAAFIFMEANSVYLPFHISSGGLKDALRGLSEIGVKGFNVTIPFKEKIMPYLDRISKEAHKIGSVNTVKLEEGSYVGYNTDHMGFIESLRRKGFDPNRKRCTIIGAGGAARSSIYQLILNGADTILIVNRNFGNAEKVTEDFERKMKFDSKLMPMGLDQKNVEKMIMGTDLVVNATPVGMKGYEPQFNMMNRWFRQGMITFDMVYGPGKTPFVEASISNGCVSIDGLEMLIYQAAEAFKIWTDDNPPIDEMRRAAKEGVGCKKDG